VLRFEVRHPVPAVGRVHSSFLYRPVKGAPQGWPSVALCGTPLVRGPEGSLRVIGSHPLAPRSTPRRAGLCSRLHLFIRLTVRSSAMKSQSFPGTACRADLASPRAKPSQRSVWPRRPSGPGQNSEFRGRPSDGPADEQVEPAHRRMRLVADRLIRKEPLQLRRTKP
jgi:hypothetical protein